MPPSLELCGSGPVRIFPEASRALAQSPVLQAVQALGVKPVVVGIVSTNGTAPELACTFANRLIGRCVFLAGDLQQSDKSASSGGIHLFYDERKRSVFLLALDAQAPIQTAQEKQDRRASALKLEVLLFSSCNMVFVVQPSARFTTTALKHLRAFAAEKQQVVTQLAAASSQKTSTKRDKSGSERAVSVFTPGRCVPLVLFVLPAPDEVLHTSVKLTKSQSATVTYCKTLEAKLVTLFRSLRGGLVGSVRMRDALSGPNVSKERRLFNIDPTHSVVVVSRQSTTDDGQMETKLTKLLDAIDVDEEFASVDAFDAHLEQLLTPLDEDDSAIGLPRAAQFLHRFTELLFSSSGHTKDAVRVELLGFAQWLKAFQSLVKAFHRMETKRKQDAVAEAAAVGTVEPHPAVYQYD